MNKNNELILVGILLVVLCLGVWYHHFNDVPLMPATAEFQQTTDMIDNLIVATGNDIPVTRNYEYLKSSTLVVKDVMENVTIIPWHNKVMKVTMRGPANLVERIVLNEKDNKLFVVGSGYENGTLGTAFTRDTNSLQIIVYVPMYTGINVMGKVGDMDIGDTEGVFSANVSGSGGFINAGKMQVTDIVSSGATRIIVASVKSSLYIDAKVRSVVDIKHGESVRHVTLNASDDSHVSFEGRSIDAATLNVSDNAHISIEKTDYEPIISQQNAGVITMLATVSSQ